MLGPPTHRRLVLDILLVLAIALCSACSTHAKLTMRQGAAVPNDILVTQRSNVDYVRAPIVGSDPHQVYVTDRVGRTIAIPRTDIVDVDHPGYWTGVVGAILLGVGLPLGGLGAYALITTDCETDDGMSVGPDCGGLASVALVVGVMHIVPGVIMAVSGFTRHDASEAAFGAHSVSVAPMMWRHQSVNHYGLGAQWKF